MAWVPNFTRVDALLYCIQYNGSTQSWTRFGTTQDPNAMIIVNEAVISKIEEIKISRKIVTYFFE